MFKLEVRNNDKEWIFRVNLKVKFLYYLHYLPLYVTYAMLLS